MPVPGSGGLWTIVHRQVEAAGRAAELRKVRRTHNPREAQAWAALRDGRTEEALTWMREQGRLRVYDTRAELHAGVVNAWWVGDRKGLMVVDSSNEERDQLNALARRNAWKPASWAPWR